MAQPGRHRSQRKKARPKVRETKSAELRIDYVGAQGDGVGLIDGAKIFVPHSAPQDRLRVKYTGARGDIEEILESGPARAAPECPHYGSCGGCALQHVEMEFYRRWKRQLVVDAMARDGFSPDIVAALVACPPATRRRASFAVRKTAAGLIFGFNEKASARIVDINHCLVLEPRLGAALNGLRSLAAATPERWCAFDFNVTLCDNGLDAVFAGGDAADDFNGREIAGLAEAARAAGALRLSVDGAVIAAFETPIVHFGGTAVAVPPGGFLQASHEGEAALVDFVVKHASGGKRIADLFSGCGTFSLPLAREASVDAYDSDAPAIAALGAASRVAGLRYPLQAQQRNLFERPLSAAELGAYDAVVFDPPRAGAQAQAVELAHSEVGKIIGVSCNPVSFARDAAILRDGGYYLSQVLPVDQFVYAPHVELVGLFTRD